MGKDNILMFVYGTLKKGFGNHFFLENCKYVGEAKLHGHAIYHLGHFPGVLPSFSDRDAVIGEVYEVDPTSLVNIDRLEGNGFLYIRKDVEVELADKKQIVQTYIYNKIVNSEWQIKDGVFRKDLPHG